MGFHLFFAWVEAKDRGEMGMEIENLVENASLYKPGSKRSQTDLPVKDEKVPAYPPGLFN